MVLGPLQFVIHVF